MWERVFALIIKELLAILRDPRGRMVIVVPPIVQLVVFSYAATLEVTNADIVVLNRDSGKWGYELIQRIEGAPTFRQVIRTGDEQQLHDLINRQKVIAAVQIGPAFSRDIEAQRSGGVQIILDGRRSNAAQIVSAYLGQIITAMADDIGGGRRTGTNITVVPRYWFNPNLTFVWFTVPSLVAIIALLV